jgi:hypothetical protein
LESGRRRGLRQSHDKFAHGPIKGSLKTAKGRLKNLKESSQLVVVKQKKWKDLRRAFDFLFETFAIR